MCLEDYKSSLTHCYEIIFLFWLSILGFCSIVTTAFSLYLQWLRPRVSNAKATVSIPGQGTKILHTTWYGQK